MVFVFLNNSLQEKREVQVTDKSLILSLSFAEEAAEKNKNKILLETVK